MKALIFALALLFALPAHALMHPDEQLRNTELEARAQNLTHTLRCVVCQNESVEDSSADIARDLRITVRKQILDGKTDDQIRAWLRERYGDYILLDPPVTSRTYALWYAPLAVLAAGIVIILLSFKRKKRR
jgi:cytochrome c-type biogenesis protein CcmH